MAPPKAAQAAQDQARPLTEEQEQAAADAAHAKAMEDPGDPLAPPVVKQLSPAQVKADQERADKAGRAAAGLPDPQPSDESKRKALVYADLARAAGYPSHYLAARSLPVGSEMGSETLPVAAFQPGDQVPAEHVEQFGWAPYVTAPKMPPAPVAQPEEKLCHAARQQP